MAKSMTGFGRGRAGNEAFALKVEIKTVNHRYRDISLRLPRDFISLESDLRRLVSANVERGKVDVYVTAEHGATSGRQVMLDRDLASSYCAAIEELEQMSNSSSNDLIAILSQQPDIFVEIKAEIDENEVKEVLLTAAKAALAELDKSRRVEGERLSNDLSAKTEALFELVATLAERAQLVPRMYREKLLVRITGLLGEERAEWYNDQRIFAETAIFADKAAVDEEITRLHSHLTTLLSSFAVDKPVGRKLDFLLQEINREVNTVGSKANDLDMTQIVIQLKTELEKIREQVQNLE